MKKTTVKITHSDGSPDTTAEGWGLVIEGFALVVHRNPSGGWKVTEPTTGHSVTGAGRTFPARQAAIARAREIMQSPSAQKFARGRIAIAEAASAGK
jgi:hypothetical protein